MRHIQCLVVLFVLVMATSVGAAEPPVGQVMAVKGAVFREAGGKREALSTGSVVFLADAIAAEGDGKAKILLSNGSILSIGEKGRITIAQYQSATNDMTTRFDARSGAFRLFVNRALARGRFEIESETAVAAVRGTDWVVEVTPERTSIVVLDGIVAVRGKAPSAGSEVLLQHFGDGTDVAGGAAPTPPATWSPQRLTATVARASFD